MFDLYGIQASVSPADFGSIIVATDGNMRQYLSNFIDIFKAIRRNKIRNRDWNLSILLSKLAVSAIFRDNIFTKFDFILNRRENLLPAKLYSFLYIIYNYIRLRRIQTIGFLSALQQMSHSTPQEQFLLHFEKLHKRIPNSLEGVTAQWVGIFLSKTN